MRVSRNKKRSALLMALLLAASIFLSCISGADRVQAAAKGDYYIKINKATNVVTVYKNDGTPYTAFTCSIGHATPLGTFYTPAKYRWWVLDGPCYGQYCTRITGGILFHSVWYYQQTKDSQSYVQYNKLGTTASHGCCRLTVAASKWIYDNCPTGTKVIIFNGTSKDDPLGKPETIKVTGYRGWDPTDPDPENPYKTKSTKPEISVSKKTIAYGSKFGDGNMTCKDSGGFDVTDWVKQEGKVNTKKIGSYPVTYSVIDSFGRTATKKITYKVVDKKPATLTGVKETLSKKCGNTRDMLVGLKAKDAAGKDLTSKIAVYIKTPSSTGYVKCKDRNYTFVESGTYAVKYIVTNPNNGLKTTKKQTIKVINTELPVLTSSDNWKTLKAEAGDEVSWDVFMKGVSAKLAAGKSLNDFVDVTVTNEDGDAATILKGQNYLFEESGTYTITYTVANVEVSEDLIAEHTRKMIVAERPEAEVILDE